MQTLRSAGQPCRADGASPRGIRFQYNAEPTMAFRVPGVLCSGKNERAGSQSARGTLLGITLCRPTALKRPTPL